MLLREWRKLHSLSLEALASKLDITPSHLSRIERGLNIASPTGMDLIRGVTEGQVTPTDLHDAWRSHRQKAAA